MFVAALFPIAPNWKPPTCPIAGEQINKLRCICIIRYYTAIRRHGLLIHVATWMDLKSSVLSESSQTQKTIYCLIPSL